MNIEEYNRVPENDGRDHQIEPLRASLLRMRTILHASMPIEKHRVGQGIAGFSFVQPNLDAVEAWPPNMNGFHDRGTQRSRTRYGSSVSRQPVVMVTMLAELKTSMS